MVAANRHVKIAERVSTRLKLKQLRLLVAVAERSSILHAAQDLNISQPAATKLIKDLEIDFGVRLFDRTNRGAIPTTFGEALVRHGKLILAQVYHAAQELDDLNEGSGGRVVVGTLLAASAWLLPAAIKAMCEDRPNVTVAVRDGTNDVLMPALSAGDVDLVVGRLPEFRHRKDLAQIRLLEEEVCIVARAGHALARQDKVEFADLVDHAWILQPPETSLRRQFEKAFFDRDLTPPAAAVESVSFLTNRELLMRTDMLGVFPYHVVAPEVARGDLTILPCKVDLSGRAVGVTYRRAGGLSPAAQAFLAVLRETAAGAAPPTLQ